jgi:hypothetical protein
VVAPTAAAISMPVKTFVTAPTGWEVMIVTVFAIAL